MTNQSGVHLKDHFNKGHSFHQRNATEDVDKSVLSQNKRNVSAIDFERGQSPVRTEGSSSKLVKNPALNSIYKKVGKYLSKNHGSQGDVSADIKRIHVEGGGPDASRISNRSNSREYQ